MESDQGLLKLWLKTEQNVAFYKFKATEVFHRTHITC